jgi:2-polyprenyl-3-methyl-5-hydroxy-6-metoxy-1,4-benzoquinol methylase
MKMTCVSCKSDISPIIQLEGLKSGYNSEDATIYSYLKCPECSIVFIYPKPNENQLEEDVYNENYFYYPPLKWYQKIVYSIYFYKDYAQWVNSEFLDKKKLLDAGCGQGEFMHTMRRSNWDVYGTEFNPYLVEMLKKEFGTEKIYTVSQYEQGMIKEKFNAITFWHVIEHLSTPVPTLESARNLLNEKGIVFIELPNADSLVLSLFKNNYTWLRIPDHVYYYSPLTLTNLLKKAGFTQIKISYPYKSNLNLSFNIYNLVKNKTNSKIAKVCLIGSIPFSLIFSLAACIAGRSEIIRAQAIK